MVESERDMLRRDEDPNTIPPPEFTSLQRTYEDSVPISPDDWPDDQD